MPIADALPTMPPVDAARATATAASRHPGQLPRGPPAPPTSSRTSRRSPAVKRTGASPRSSASPASTAPRLALGGHGAPTSRRSAACPKASPPRPWARTTSASVPSLEPRRPCQRHRLGKFARRPCSSRSRRERRGRPSRVRVDITGSGPTAPPRPSTCDRGRRNTPTSVVILDTRRAPPPRRQRRDLVGDGAQLTVVSVQPNGTDDVHASSPSRPASAATPSSSTSPSPSAATWSAVPVGPLRRPRRRGGRLRPVLRRRRPAPGAAPVR